MDASRRDAAEAYFSSISGLPGIPAPNIEAAMIAISNIPPAEPWLLFLDNADDVKTDYAPYFPSGNRGSIVMISRNPECGRTYENIGWQELDNLDEDDGITLLFKAARVPDVSQVEQHAAAMAVVKAVGCHALAIV